MTNLKDYSRRIIELEAKIADLKFELEDTRNLLNIEKDKKDFYQLIADFTFGWELWFAPGGKIKYCSPSCYDLTGFTSNQILTTSSISELLVYEADSEKYNEFLSGSIEQLLVNQSLEFRILTRSKQLRWCSMNVRGVYDRFGRYLGIRASVHDVTRLKRAMGSIRELEAGREYHAKTKQRMQSEIDLKDRELVSFLLQLSQKNEIINSAKKIFKGINPEDSDGLRAKIVRLNQVFEDCESDMLEWSMIENQLERIHPGFFNRLQLKHTVITIKDKKLCAYLRLGLSSREIAGLLNLTSKSVEIARVRLRKKLKLNREVRLVTYLSAL